MSDYEELAKRVAALKDEWSKTNPTVVAQAELGGRIADIVSSEVGNNKASIKNLSMRTGIPVEKIQEILDGAGCHTDDLAAIVVALGLKISIVVTKE